MIFATKFSGKKSMRLALCSLVSLSRGGMAALQSAPRRALWVDTDAGFDDLLALGALSRDAALEVVTVGSGACETPLDGARRVARFLGALGRSDVRVVAGTPAPRVDVAPWLVTARRKMIEWCSEHLPADGPGLAVDESVEAAVAKVAPRACLCLGPLGNVAEALSAAPSLERVVVMGGNRLDDVSPEFNLACDPAAAAEVFARAPGLECVGLDVCDADVLSPVGADLGARCAASTATRARLLGSLCATDVYAAVCDPVAAFALVDAGGVEAASATVVVDDAGVLRAGDGGRPARVARGLDAAAYAAWLEDAVLR